MNSFVLGSFVVLILAVMIEARSPLQKIWKVNKIVYDIETNVPNACPEGWVASPTRDVCIGNDNHEKATFDDALNACRSKGGTLAQPRTQAEQDVIASLYPNTNVWIGLDDMENEGTFVWSDGTPFCDCGGYNNWNEGEPNDLGGNEDCTHLLPNGRWNDLNCNKKIQYVCEVGQALLALLGQSSSSLMGQRKLGEECSETRQCATTNAVCENMRCSCEKGKTPNKDGTSCDGPVTMQAFDKTWIVFQRRTTGDTDFWRTWSEYEEGFGTKDSDFWLGLRKVRELCPSNCELLMKFRYESTDYWARYSSFWIEPASQFYKLHIDGFSGNMKEDGGMSYSNEAEFSTYDNDHTGVADCPAWAHSAWWFHNCAYVNFNGIFGSKEAHKGLKWRGLTHNSNSVDYTFMLLRQKN